MKTASNIYNIEEMFICYVVHMLETSMLLLNIKHIKIMSKAITLKIIYKTYHRHYMYVYVHTQNHIHVYIYLIHYSISITII